LIFFLIALVFLGAAFSRWFKIFVILPTTFVVWLAAAHLAKLEGLSWMAVIGAAFLAGICLQFGYVAGAALMPYWRAAARKSAVTSPGNSR
jgi:hypothetical protein